MNVVFALKLVAIVASGFFGVLGLVTDFRNKETGKLSAWGVLALIGVVLSSSVAFAIQYMEAIQDEKSSVHPTFGDWLFGKLQDSVLVNLENSEP